MIELKIAERLMLSSTSRVVVARSPLLEHKPREGNPPPFFWQVYYLRPWRILGLTPGVTDDVLIRKHWKRLCLRYHPDKNQQASDHRFIELTEAYQCIKDDKSRAQYKEAALQDFLHYSYRRHRFMMLSHDHSQVLFLHFALLFRRRNFNFLFSSNNQLPPYYHLSLFHRTYEPETPLSVLFVNLVHHLELPPQTLIASFILLERFLARAAFIPFDRLTAHDLLTTALLVADKSLSEKGILFGNASWALIAQLPTPDINLLEAFFLNVLDFDSYITPEEFARAESRYLAKVKSLYPITGNLSLEPPFFCPSLSARTGNLFFDLPSPQNTEEPVEEQLSWHEPEDERQMEILEPVPEDEPATHYSPIARKMVSLKELRLISKTAAFFRSQAQLPPDAKPQEMTLLENLSP